MRTLLNVLLLLGLAASTSPAQQLCAPPAGALGGNLDSDDGATLRTRFATSLAGRVTSADGAELLLGLGSGGCEDGAIATAVGPGAVPPPRTNRLLPIAPNPFNPRAEVRFELGRRGEVRIEVFDVSGRLVRNVVEGVLDAGMHVRTLDGEGLASGVYHVRMRTTDGIRARSVVLLK